MEGTLTPNPSPAGEGSGKSLILMLRDTQKSAGMG